MCTVGGMRVKGLAKGMRRLVAMEARLGGGRPGFIRPGWNLKVTGKPTCEEAAAMTRERTMGCGQTGFAWQVRWSR